MEEEINYKTLRKIQETEKNSPILTKIYPNFYEDLSKYVTNLEKRIEKEDSPQKKLLLKEEIENTKKIVLHIYEKREKKIILSVISKVRGGTPDIKNMIENEKKLFDSTLTVMTDSRKKLFNHKSENNNLENEIKKPVINSNKKESNNNPIIRITKDIPEFVGTDTKKYNLRKNDIVSLPEDMNKMLTKRGAGKEVKR